MKRILILAVLLAGCDEMAADGNNTGPHGYNQPVYMYQDKATGCQYVSADSEHSALTPRVAADGKTHMGCKGGQP
jgi:hypothetical protein